MRRGILARCTALGLVAVCATGAARAKTCTKELLQKDLSGSEPFEMTCETVALKLPPIESEMYYHRWSGEFSVRSIRGDDEARINLAAFDAAGDLVGAAGAVAHGVGKKSKKISFRMDAMYLSTVNVAKVLVSVSLPDRKDH